MEKISESLITLAPIIASFAVGCISPKILRWSYSHIISRLPLYSPANKMKLVLIVRTDLGFNKRQMASYSADVAITCYKQALLDAPMELKSWKSQGQAKIALKPDFSGEEILIKYADKAITYGLINCILKNDENMVSAIGIGPGKADMINKVVGHLSLL